MIAKLTLGVTTIKMHGNSPKTGQKNPWKILKKIAENVVKIVDIFLPMKYNDKAVEVRV